MIGVGFIGLGGMGKYQAASFSRAAGCKIVAGADLSAAAGEEFAKSFTDASVYGDYKQLLSDKQVDAVVVAVPTGFHRDIVLDVLRSGRPVLVEKPMARTVEQCRQMLDLADKTGKLLMVAHCRRFDNDWGTFATTYRAGELGEKVLWRKLVAGRIRGEWYVDDALGGGPLMDGAVHDYDFADLLFGPAESVVGSHLKLDPNCTGIDTGNAIIRYRNGCQMVVTWSWAVSSGFWQDALGAKNSFVFGPNGLPVPEGLRGHCLVDPAGNKKLLTFEPRDMYVTQAEHFIDCLERGTKCLSPGVEALKAVAVAEAVLKACRTGEMCEIRSQ